MRKQNGSASYLFLGLILFCWMSLPTSSADKIRSYAASSLSPAWIFGKKIDGYLSDRPGYFWDEKHSNRTAELHRLQLENQTLREQIEKISHWLSSEQRIQEQLRVLHAMGLEEKGASDSHWRSFFQRRSAHLRDLLQWEVMAMPAQPIYRDPSSWSSCMWINVGDDDNRVLGRCVIAKNSPVIAGNALVGVIDYVGKKQSRVRLITDSGLSPSVRAVRGASQEREIASLVQALLERISEREEAKSLVSSLELFKTHLKPVWEEGYLAKGELRGSSAPFWRSRSPKLKGFGFNFDYADEEGAPQREIPFLEKGDLLVTSGLDGVFPPGLSVGRVTAVSELKPGDYAYEIEASPTAFHLNDLEMLFVLPPRNSE